MSRLADRLMGMDAGRRPIGQGWIPGLAPPAARSRKWRIVVALVILLCMAAAAAAVALFTRPRGTAAPAAPPRASIVRPAVAPVPVSGRSPSPPAPNPAALQALAQARAAAGRGDLGDATRLFRDALRARPDDAEAWNDLGVVRVRQGDLAAGTDAFRQALQRQPAHHEALRNLGVVLDRRGRRQEAEEQYRRFLDAAAGSSHPAVEDVRRRLQELETAAIGGVRP